MTDELSPVEGIKSRSNFLRGNIVDSLADAATGSLAEDDTQLSKFHGFYQQDDRDIRAERTQQKLEPLHSFMIRVRVPAGVASSEQWLAMDRLATTYANGSLRLTTRQAFQFHGVFKRDLKTTIRRINDSLLDTIAACGDVNRNVMCTPLSELSATHAAASEIAADISRHLTPNTAAYHEIWLDKKKVAGSNDSEPIYGATYLPRKFKIGIAIPPANDIDVFSQDLGYIAVEQGGELVGFNVTAGGGMGTTQGDDKTYPRTADVIGFCTPEQAVQVAEHVVTLQRDYGDRTERKHARLKYTIADRGIEWFKEELYSRLGFRLLPPEPFLFTDRGDPLGWTKGRDGNWHLSLFVPEGRITDSDECRFLSALREVAANQDVEFRLTANQNVIISNVPESARADIEATLQSFGVSESQEISPLRRLAIACVALPTCSLAMAEAERYLPEMTSKVDSLLTKYEISNPISFRISGCPNGCARPFLAEIALVGKAPGRYSLYLGGSFDGLRLNKLVAPNVDESETLAILDDWLSKYARVASGGISFGDFVYERIA